MYKNDITLFVGERKCFKILEKIKTHFTLNMLSFQRKSHLLWWKVEK